MENKFLWAYELDEIFQEFQTDPKKGLTDEKAQQLLLSNGLNELPKAKQSFLRVYLAPLFNWLIIIYLIAAVIMFVAGKISGESDMKMIYITLAIVGLNCLVAIFQQARATKKLNALRELSAPSTRVIRSGQKQEIFSKKICVGDLLVLSPGDRIPADARIIQSANLRVNEASLTGESEPVKKNNGKPLKNTPLHLQNQENILFYGTFITTGTGFAIVIKTGINTEIGKISQGLESANSSEIPIRTKLNNIGKWFGIGVILAWLIVLIVLWLSTGELKIIESLNSAMDIMPINIPLLTTIVMLTGVLKMAEHGVIIRNLTSVDSLGRVSVVCSDKTGTLTKSQMCVQHVWTRGSRFKVTGSGYNPEGEIFLVDNPTIPEKVTDIQKFPHLEMLLTAGALNNNASLIKHEFELDKNKKKRSQSDWKVIGNPTEGALKALYSKINDPQKLDKFEEVMEFPFSSQAKRMSKIYKDEIGDHFIFTKGASEVLMYICDKMLAENNEAVDFIIEMKLIVMNTINEYARQGYRVLSLAYRPIDGIPPDTEEGRELAESDLVYIGFVAIMDPPRDDVKDAVERCHSAGVDVVMITGDSLNTAIAIGSQISIITDKRHSAMEGNQIDDEKNFENINDVRVFARVSPTHKQTIVERYQNEGRVVAMTGDGVNDALALNMADAGVAMGIQGTDVAKEAADMVISDDSFSSIVEGIHRGRGIFANIRSVVFFFICINLFEGIVQFILYVILGKPYFLTSAFTYQWVYLSLTMHMFPGLILTFDSVSKDVMEEAPRDSEEIISNKFLILMGIYGCLLAVSMLLTYFYGTILSPVRDSNNSFGNFNSFYLFTESTRYLSEGVDPTIAKTLTMLMTTLFLCECTLALQIRRPNKSLAKSIKDDGNPFMFIVVGILLVVYLAILYIPGLQVFLAKNGLNFQFMVLNIVDWSICIFFSFICIGTFELVKLISRKKGIKF
ncbi:cation-translocating P-type ATPase [Candidatus Lokiarchaeum ossiferum]|uniref:cation-translocating P-type ATPase n=1 Tax=Candidatus Lokiarchaeum ossiferum TaxID=2951803 RepID=UPI00352D09C7